MKFPFRRPLIRLPRSRQASPPGRRTAPHCRPRLEDLEPRETPDCSGVYWPAPYNTLLSLPFTSVCNLNDGGGGSLRQAIIDVNSQPPGLYTIYISIPAPQVQQPHVIHLLSPLPPIQNPVTIDAITYQLDWDTTRQAPVVQIDGAAAGRNANGLVLNGAGSLVAGLIVSNFGGSGIILQGGSGDTVEGCYIGTDPTGTLSQANNIGITVRNGAARAIIGPANVISGNLQAGVLLTTAGVTHTVVHDNRIGTDYLGRSAVPNRANGVVISQGSSDNRIRYNQISGNIAAGVSVQDRASHHNVIIGNRIGTNAAGTLPLGNGTGVEVNQALDTIIGRPGKVNKRGVVTKNFRRNLISGNTVGINVINVQPDLAAGERGAIIRNNLIGTDITGMAPLRNAAGGITIQNSAGTTVGSLSPYFPNVIAANGNQGVLIAGGSSHNLIEGNYIGTDVTGRNPLSNTIGVYIQGGVENTIGGTLAGAGNVLSGNSAAGLTVVTVPFNPATGNIIQGNLIGTDPTHTLAVPNGVGINVAQMAANTTIGGTTPGSGNVIFFNSTYGISIADQSRGSLLEGNAIFANGIHGILISRASDNTIGGLAPGAANAIAGDGSDAILVDTGTGNLIQGNSIYGHPRLAIELSNGGNLSQQAPRITSAATDPGLNVTFVSGTLVGRPNADYTVDIYYDLNLDRTGFGEGQYYLGTITVTTDAGGNASFSTIIDGTTAPYGAAPVGSYVSATATDPNNNTSQFSVAVPVGVAGPSAGDGGAGTMTVADPTPDAAALARALGDIADQQLAVATWAGGSTLPAEGPSAGQTADSSEPLPNTGAAGHQAVDTVFASSAETSLEGGMGDFLDPVGRPLGELLAPWTEAKSWRTTRSVGQAFQPDLRRFGPVAPREVGRWPVTPASGRSPFFDEVGMCFAPCFSPDTFRDNRKERTTMSSHISQPELEKYRQTLLALGRRIRGDVDGLSGEALRRSGGEASGNLSNAPMHLADLGTDNYEQEMSVSLLETEERTLEEIAAALERINQGTFGRCEECQREIGQERLRALPYTRHCVDCARRLEGDRAPAGFP